MRILFATDQYAPTPGGIAVVTYHLAKILTQKRHTVAVIAPSTSWKYKKETQEGFTVFRIQSILVFKKKQIRYAPTFLYKNEIQQIIDEFKPDIIHIETPNDIAYTTVQLAKKAKI